MARRPRNSSAGPSAEPIADPFAGFHPLTAQWFQRAYGQPTAPQRVGWPVIARGESALILAPTGSGKTLTAFLWCLDRLMLHPRPENPAPGARVLYISPLKALAVDVERNLRVPLAGITEAARRAAVPFHEPSIAVRTGDTSSSERAKFRRHPADILITTPESLYLMLTSQTAEALRTIDTVIIDEIHALVPTKRGAHLALSLERLEAIVRKPLQRIGLSATQRPLEEVARFLGGVEVAQPTVTESVLSTSDWSADNSDPIALRYRPVTIVNASAPKRLKLRIEVPVEDMARLAETEIIADGTKPNPPRRISIWNAIHPRLLELIRPRKSTILFVNSRQIAERLAGALNDLAGEPIVRAHHGSLAANQRSEIEEDLKAGRIKALCATSTLELGIDMGAVDLVIQVESPPSVASGMQRIGRAGHQVDAVSEGILIPKFRADLVACAAVTRAMHEGHIESTRYPRNPLDVLAQQVVATVAYPPMLAQPRSRGHAPAEPEISVDALYNLVRRAAPFAGLTQASFEGVLDLLSGRYPSDEFADLRPRITWDRTRDILTPREGAARIAILNAGTIPDRGLYGVFLAHNEGKPVRVGELDEEMVFETRTNETFILGASTWRIAEITHDRVLVEPAPGEPGKMPFWKGDSAGRPLEFGLRIGALIRELREMPRPAALTRLVTEHDLDPVAAENLLTFLDDQHSATGVVPDDRTILIERTRDELGDWRVCVLTPFGRRIHIPWAMAVAARIRAAGRTDVETIWGDDGFVLRFPDTDEPPDADWFLVPSADAMQLVLNQLGATALFAGRFREAAGRALLLPRKRIDRRSPLWQLRKRSYDLLSVASRYPSFPLLLEAYRECLRDVFDMPALLETLRSIEQRHTSVHVINTLKPSPFASSLLFSYVANFLYDLDAPIAERCAQALTIDQDQLRELLGDTDLRELLDPAAIRDVESSAQCLTETTQARSADGIHDLLLKLGDLSRDELAERIAAPELLLHVDKLLRARRLVEPTIAGQPRLIAVEDAARYRDALDIRLPKGLPASLLVPVAQPLLELLRRYARTHGPFTTQDAAARFGLNAALVEAILHPLAQEGRILEGSFRPSGIHREWCDAEILRHIRQKSLARLRKEVEPVSQATLARFLTHWQGLIHSSPVPARRNLDALLDAIESLQGAPLAASLMESSILPVRVAGYDPSQLDTLIAAGEVIWTGVEPLGSRDGRVALYLADKASLLSNPRPQSEPLSEREETILAFLGASGASFFEPLHQAVGSGFPGDSIEALWSLVWRGLVTNDSLHALRAYIAPPESSRPHRVTHTGVVFRSRRTTPPEAQGRWSLVLRTATQYSATERSHALALQLLHRYGVLMREHASAENIPGGFSAVYDVLKALEESGRIRRGYFVAGLGATQFALPAALDLLRRLRSTPNADKDEFVQIAAADPANPYGSVLPWSAPPAESQDSESAPRILTRASYAEVILRNGELVAWLRRDNPNALLFLPVEEPDRTHVAASLAHFLFARGQQRLQAGERSAMLISTVNGVPVGSHTFASFLLDAGFHSGPLGMNIRRIPSLAAHSHTQAGQVTEEVQ